MESSNKDSQIQLSIKGTFVFDGIRANYTQLLNGVCCAIAMDIDRSGNKKLQYLIAHVLFENVKSYIIPSILPPVKGVITKLNNLTHTVDIRKYTEYAYTNINELPKTSFQILNSVKYFVGDNELVKITYNLTINICEFLESSRIKLQFNNYHSLFIQIDKVLTDNLKYLHKKTLGKPYNIKQISGFIAENVKTLGNKELLMTNPIMNKLQDELESKLKIDLNEVE